MKINYIVIFLSFFCLKVAFAQEDSTKLFYTKGFESTVFVDVGSDFIQVNKSGGMNFNLSLNWMAQQKYIVGISYSQLASVEQFEYSNLSMPSVSNAYGELKHQSFGLRLGYVFLPEHKIVSVSPEVTAGWGNAGLKIKGQGFNEKIHFGKIKPSVNAVFNISKFFKIGLNIHYRVHLGKSFTEDESMYVFNFSPSDLNGVGGGVFFRFGKF